MDDEGTIIWGTITPCVEGTYSEVLKKEAIVLRKCLADKKAVAESTTGSTSELSGLSKEQKNEMNLIYVEDFFNDMYCNFI